MAQIALPQIPPLQCLNLDQFDIKSLDVEIESCPAQFFNIFRRQAYRLTDMSPDHVKGIKVVSGDWYKVGSIKECTYVPQGASTGDTETLKDILAFADENTKMMCYHVLEGKIMQYYKTLYAIFAVQELPCNNSARWTVIYQKQGDIDPIQKYLDLLKAITEDVDGHLH